MSQYNVYPFENSNYFAYQKQRVDTGKHNPEKYNNPSSSTPRPKMGAQTASAFL
jgi:hypothetical protein